MAIGTATAVLGGALIGGASSLMAGRGQAAAAQSAANTQANASRDAAAVELQATREAVAENRRQYDVSREDLAPYRRTGEEALNELMNAMGQRGETAYGGVLNRFTTSPGYGFRLGEGIKAVERSAAARGGLLSGGTMRAVQRYGEGLAADEFGNHINRLSALAGVGQTATNTGVAAGQNYAARAGNALMAGGQAAGMGMRGAGNALAAGMNNAGAARASGYVGVANAATSGINNMLYLQALERGQGGR